MLKAVAQRIDRAGWMNGFRAAWLGPAGTGEVWRDYERQRWLATKVAAWPGIPDCS